MTIKIRPLHDRVLIRRNKPEEKSKGGIVLPAIAQQKEQEGEVLAIGPGRWDHGIFVDTTVKPGQRVLFSKYAGEIARAMRDEHRAEAETVILREEELLAVLDD